MADLIDLGFAFSAKNAEDAIGRMMTKLTELESKKISIDNLFKSNGLSKVNKNIGNPFGDLSKTKSDLSAISVKFDNLSSSASRFAFNIRAIEQQFGSLALKIDETGKMMNRIAAFSVSGVSDSAMKSLDRYRMKAEQASGYKIQAVSGLPVQDKNISSVSDLVSSLSAVKSSLADLSQRSTQTFSIINQGAFAASGQIKIMNAEIGKIGDGKIGPEISVKNLAPMDQISIGPSFDLKSVRNMTASVTELNKSIAPVNEKLKNMAVGIRNLESSFAKLPGLISQSDKTLATITVHADGAYQALTRLSSIKNIVPEIRLNTDLQNITLHLEQIAEKFASASSKASGLANALNRINSFRFTGNLSDEFDRFISKNANIQVKMPKFIQTVNPFVELDKTITAVSGKMGGLQTFKLKGVESAERQISSLNVRIGETGKLVQNAGSYQIRANAEQAVQQFKVLDNAIGTVTAKMGNIGTVKLSGIELADQKLSSLNVRINETALSLLKLGKYKYSPKVNMNFDGELIDVSKISVAENAVSALGQNAQKSFGTIIQGASSTSYRLQELEKTITSVSGKMGGIKFAEVKNSDVAAMADTFNRLTDFSKTASSGLAVLEKSMQSISKHAVTVGSALSRLSDFQISQGALSSLERLRVKLEQISGVAVQSPNFDSTMRKFSDLQYRINESGKTLQSIGQYQVSPSVTLKPVSVKVDTSGLAIAENAIASFSRKYRQSAEIAAESTNTVSVKLKELGNAVNANVLKSNGVPVEIKFSAKALSAGLQSISGEISAFSRNAVQSFSVSGQSAAGLTNQFKTVNAEINAASGSVNRFEVNARSVERQFAAANMRIRETSDLLKNISTAKVNGVDTSALDRYIVKAGKAAGISGGDMMLNAKISSEPVTQFNAAVKQANDAVKMFEISSSAALAKVAESASALTVKVKDIASAAISANAELKKVRSPNISVGSNPVRPSGTKGITGLSEQLGKLEGQIAPLGGSFQNTFTVITQAIGQAKTQAARFNGEVSKIAVSLNKTGTSIGKITAQMKQLAEAVSRTAIRTEASESAMRKMASVNPVNPAAIASVDQLKMKLQEASLAARSFRPIGKIGGSVSVGGLRNMTGGFNSANFAARNLRDTLISMATGGGLAYYFADVTRAAVKFGEELSYIQSLTLDFSKQDMRAGILNMGSMLGDATKNAEAAYYAYSSGVRGGEKGIISFTGNMAKLAKIIRADVIPTVNSVTTIMNAYNLTAADSAELTDLFYGIIKQGKANGPQLASGLGQVASTAATADLSLNELGAAVASLTKVNSTRNAITYLNNMLSKMIKPTKEARLAAQKLGIELGLDAVRAKGFTALMQEIREKTQGSQQALLALFPDLRGQRAALQLLNRGWDDFNKQLGFFANKAGIADEAFQNLEEDLNQQLGALPVTFNKIKIAAGDTITNILTLGGTLAPLIRDFNNMDESGQKLAGGIALVVGGLVTMKIAGLTLNTVKAMEIRNNAIILEQQKQERRNRAALTLAAAKEAAAKKAASAVTIPGVIPAAGKTVTKKPAASTAVDVAMSTIKAAKASSVASAPAVDGKAIASMQAYNALKLQYASEGVKNAAAAKKAAAAYYEETAAAYAAAIAKANDAKETSALTTMMKQDAQWRMKMASVNQSHLGSLTAIAQAEKANAAAAYQMAVADEKAARIKASLTVTGARLAGTPLENAKAGLDAANASLLSASMKEKEVLANAKLSASEIANMTAVGKGVLTRKDKLAMVDKILSRVALEKSLMLDAARAEEQAALATRDFIAQDSARLKVKAAEQAFLKAEAAAAKGRIAYMKAENKILAMNIALQKRRAVGNSFTKIIEGQGFIGGFGRSGVANLREVQRMLKFEGLGLSMSKLGAGVGKLSAGFLGLIPIMTKIGIVAGAVAAVGGLIDVVRTKQVDNGLDTIDWLPDWMQSKTWNNKVANSAIVSKVADSIYNFFTEAFDKAKEFEERMKMLAESRGQIFANMDTLFMLTDKYLQDYSDPKKMTNSMLETLQKNYKMAYDNLTTGSVKAMQAELKNVTRRMAKLQPELARGFNMSEVVMRLNKEFNANLQIQNGEVVASGIKIPGGALAKTLSGPIGNVVLNAAELFYGKVSENDKKALAAYQAEKAAFDAKIKEQNDLMKKSEEMTNAIAKGKTQYDKYATQLVSYWKAQQEELESMSDIIAKQRFKMKDPEEKINKLIADANAGFDGFTKLMKSNTKNASMLHDSLKGFITPANDAIARLKKNIEGFDKMIESSMKRAFDYRYAGAKTDADRIKMMQERSAKLMKESGMVSGNGTFELSKITDKDLEKSYSKVTEAIRLNVDAKKIEIERYKHLAEAERRANEKTLELIRSMDKLGETAVDAVDANSLDAVKLQSRSFIELPQMNFAQNAENDLGSAQQELRKIYEQAAKIVEAFTQEAETRKQKDQDSVNTLSEKITTAMGQVEKKIKTLEEKTKEGNKKIQEEVARIEGEKMTMMKTITTYVTKLGQNVGRF